MDKPIQVYLPEDKKKEFKELAKNRGSNISVYARQLIYKEIDEAKKAA